MYNQLPHQEVDTWQIFQTHLWCLFLFQGIYYLDPQYHTRFAYFVLNLSTFLQQIVWCLTSFIYPYGWVSPMLLLTFVLYFICFHSCKYYQQVTITQFICTLCCCWAFGQSQFWIIMNRTTINSCLSVNIYMHFGQT